MKLKCIFIITFFICILFLSITAKAGWYQSDENYKQELRVSETLSEACFNGKIAEAKQFIQNGVDVNAYDRWGWTPLMWASYSKNLDIVRLLLESGARPNLASTYAYNTIPTGSTALMMAAYNRQAMIVKLLLEHKADKKIKNEYGLTAESYAKNADSEETYDLLKD